jgi:hypothetical protein
MDLALRLNSLAQTQLDPSGNFRWNPTNLASTRAVDALEWISGRKPTYLRFESF